MSDAVVIASYRGPAGRSAGSPGGGPKGAGGLIQVLQPWARERQALWVFAGEDGGDRGARADCQAAPVSIDPAHRRGHYDLVSNSILWPHFHGLHGWASESISSATAESGWQSFRAVNHSFAERIAELAPTGAKVVVHDYQLLLVPGALKVLRPDLNVVYFHHIPFASAAEFGAFPAEWREEVAGSLGGCNCGFQSPRWQDRYLDFCGAEGIGAAASFIAPVYPDLTDLDETAASHGVESLRRSLRSEFGGRKLIARVDRADPMKNVLGGVRAFDLLLTRYPAWRGRVVFAHHLVPTRGSVEAYRRYLDEVMAAIEDVNRRWEDGDWQPLHVNLADQREYGLALFAEYDVLLVNPIREGMNLVAHEGPALNERNGVLVLSQEAGAHDALAPAAIGVDPVDDSGTAAALAEALEMPDEARAARARALRSTLAGLNRHSWHDKVVSGG